MLKRWLPALAILALLAAAVAALRRELKAFQWHDIVAHGTAIPTGSLVVAALLTLVSLLVLPCYDTLGLRYAGKKPPVRKVVFASMIAYGFSHVLGFPLLTGGSVHYRFWSSWGLTAGQVAKGVSFSAATMMVGTVFVTGVACVLSPVEYPDAIGMPNWVFRTIGVVCLAAAAGYLYWSATHRGQLTIRTLTIPLPSLRVAIVQLLVSSADWIAGGAVLYALLPQAHGMGFWGLIGAYTLAHSVGLVSHVPGGLGVFDAMMVLFWRPYFTAEAAIGTLVVYRAIYYIAPFICAMGMLSASEIVGIATNVKKPPK